ncbi:cofactor FMO1 FAD enzyme [Lasiosphaeria hispida]|uniref:Cofactor FMO1 FAD enzyme n=1 Tax=Lasiosphaeria hispida TaxID=260671 RepID=A0AAJ0H828_9PEZI|nr:cofactor FMO1 FAD enzyme [Lasiosphaeria hispida]
MAEQFDVIVVGTGWNGLIGAKTYLDFAPTAKLVLLDEQSSIGGVWSKEKIYPNLYAQIKYGQFEYSFYPMRKEGITSDGYISGETINRYLSDFASDYDLVRRTRFRTKVVRVERLGEGAGWRLEIEGQPAIECAKLIYASGATSHPVIPSYANSGFQAPVMHSSETGMHLEALEKIQTATVVGAAKSAYDTVFLLLKAGKKVNWVIRQEGSGPLALMPPTILGLFNTMDAVATRMVGLLGSSIMNKQGRLHRFLHQTLVGQTVTKTFWATLNLIADTHAGYSLSANANKLRPLPYGNGIFWANAGLGAASVPDFWKVFHAGDCTVHRTEIESLGEDNVVKLRDGSSFATDYIVLCTGFDKSYHPFAGDLQRSLGLAPDPSEQAKWGAMEAEAAAEVDSALPAIQQPPLPRPHHDEKGKTGPAHGPSRHYRRLVVPSLVAQGDRSIYFPGFIHSIYTPLVSESQALWGVTFLLGLQDHDLPSQAEMESEVATWTVWSRKRYMVQGRKHAYAIYDFLSYVDTLLRDLGVDMTGKRNLLQELLQPVYPRDYRGLVDEYRRVQLLEQLRRLGGAAAGAGEGR